MRNGDVDEEEAEEKASERKRERETRQQILNAIGTNINSGESTK